MSSSRTLLIAASRGGQAMMKVLEDTLLCHATEQVLHEHTWVAGVDGYPAGWFVVLRNRASGECAHLTLASFREVLQACEHASVVAVDIPIGLMHTSDRSGRPVDRLARERLKPSRSSSVFPAPCRPAVDSETYQEAVAATRQHSNPPHSLSKQAFGLSRKLREVDGLMTPELQAKVREVHPELSFAALNGARPLRWYKKKPEGRTERLALLRAAGFAITEEGVHGLARCRVGKDDVIDAYAACWSAGRIAREEAEQLPEHPDKDERGLRMEMWI